MKNKLVSKNSSQKERGMFKIPNRIIHKPLIHKPLKHAQISRVQVCNFVNGLQICYKNQKQKIVSQPQLLQHNYRVSKLIAKPSCNCKTKKIVISQKI